MLSNTLPLPATRAISISPCPTLPNLEQAAAAQWKALQLRGQAQWLLDNKKMTTVPLPLPPPTSALLSHPWFGMGWHGVGMRWHGLARLGTG